MKPTEKQIDQQIKQLHCPAGKYLDKRLQILFDGAAQKQITRPAFDRMGWRIMMNSRLFKFAAIILVIAAIMLGIGLFNITGSKSNLVFADIIKPFYTAKCVSYDVVLNNKEVVIQDMVMGNKIRRVMSNLPSITYIIDLGTGKMLSLRTDSKEAVVADLKGLPQAPENHKDHLCTLFNTIQNDERFTVETLGCKTEDNRQLAGLLAKGSDVEVEIWVDTATQMPVQIEERRSHLKTTIRKLEFHNEIDESLFSMEVPQGYKTEDVGQINLQNATEQDFIEGLRILASINEGCFPACIDVAFYIQNPANSSLDLSKLNVSDKEKKDLISKFVRHLLFLRFYKGKGDWHWAGNGVKLGEAEKPIFWYQPADSENFRVIFGDLSVQEVAADKLDEITRPAQAAQQPAYQITEDVGFVCEQKDTWHIQAGGQIEIHAEIELQKGPKDAPNIVIQLPYDAGVVKSVMMADKRLSFTALDKGQFQITFDPALLKAGKTDLTVVWAMPIATLPYENNKFFKVKLAPLMPATAYRLNVTIEPDSGWVNSEDPARQTFTPFFCNGPDPFTDMGSCGLTIKPKQ